jgi:hypothetical protein
MKPSARSALFSRVLDGCGWINCHLLAGIGIRGSRLIRRDEFVALISWLSPVAAGFDLIRVGDAGDGGYLLPDDIEGIAACFSPGTDDRISFEKEFARRGVPCYLADASVAAGSFLEDPCIHFDSLYIGSVSRGLYASMEDWIGSRLDDVAASGDLLLQMDIEGWEYQAFLACPLDLLAKFRIIVVEFHDFHRCLELNRYRDIVEPMIWKLASLFDPVHVHPNNASGLFSYAGIVCPVTFELTLHRKDRQRLPPHPVVEGLPHPLDVDNVSLRPSLSLAGWPSHRDWALDV